MLQSGTFSEFGEYSTEDPRMILSSLKCMKRSLLQSRVMPGCVVSRIAFASPRFSSQPDPFASYYSKLSDPKWTVWVLCGCSLHQFEGSPCPAGHCYESSFARSGRLRTAVPILPALAVQLRTHLNGRSSDQPERIRSWSGGTQAKRFLKSEVPCFKVARVADRTGQSSMAEK